MVRFPLQPDPHAAYSYIAVSTPEAEADDVAFVVRGEFPYAAWTSWDVYGKQGKPTAVENDAEITPDSGSVNPFVVGNRVRAHQRAFTLLLLPGDISQSAIAPSLRAIPNLIQTPTDTNAWVLANRVYEAFPRYSQGGSGGPTQTPFPQVSAVNWTTGAPVPCAPYNLIPKALQRPPTDPPRTGSTRPPTNPPRTGSTQPPARRITLTNGQPLQRADSPTTAPIGAEYAPPNPPGRLRFTRPPLAAGADVSAVPPPDNCAGYLGTATSVRRISLIRMPRVPTFFDVNMVRPTTTFPDTQAAYVSATQYGASLGVYASGSPFSTSLGDAEFKIDRTGGSTFLIWPRVLSRQERRLVFAYADQRGWAILRGGTRNQFTTPNLLIREKGSSNYQNGVGHVPCYYGTPDNPMHSGQRWARVHGSQYVASPHNIGPGAPQGVTCTVKQTIDAECLRSLKAYIRRNGGSYFAH